MAIAWVRTCDNGNSHTVLCRKHFRCCLSLSEDGWKNEIDQQHSRALQGIGAHPYIVDMNRFNLYNGNQDAQPNDYFDLSDICKSPGIIFHIHIYSITSPNKSLGNKKWFEIITSASQVLLLEKPFEISVPILAMELEPQCPLSSAWAISCRDMLQTFLPAWVVPCYIS